MFFDVDQTVAEAIGASYCPLNHGNCQNLLRALYLTSHPGKANRRWEWGWLY